MPTIDEITDLHYEYDIVACISPIYNLLRNGFTNLSNTNITFNGIRVPHGTTFVPDEQYMLANGVYIPIDHMEAVSYTTTITDEPIEPLTMVRLNEIMAEMNQRLITERQAFDAIVNSEPEEYRNNQITIDTLIDDIQYLSQTCRTEDHKAVQEYFMGQNTQHIITSASSNKIELKTNNKVDADDLDDLFARIDKVLEENK